MVAGFTGLARGYSRGGDAPDGPVITKCGPTVYFRFVPGDAEWTDAKKDIVRTALNRWENVADENGASVVRFVQNETDNVSPLIRIRRDNSPGGNSGALGFADCNEANGGGTLQLAVSLDGDNLQGIATHEAGHVLGLAHVGKFDSLQDGQTPPTMVSGACVSSSVIPDLITLSNDDHAGLMQRQGGASAMHADISFEQGIGPRWSTRFADATRVSGSPTGKGAMHLKLAPASAFSNDHPRVYQDVLVYKLGTHDGGVYVKKGDPDHFGAVYLKVWKRPYQASSVNGAPAFCNTSPDGDFVLEAENQISPTASWELYGTGDKSVTRDRVDAQIVFRNELRGRVGGDTFLVPAYVDVLRGRTR